VTYPKVDPQPNFPAVENETLEFWASDHTFQASIDQRDAGGNGVNEYVFYD
jgi:isoleucyl-tRNA synthetase